MSQGSSARNRWSASASAPVADLPSAYPLILCPRCGLEDVIMRVCQKEGENKGRTFYKCPRYKSISSDCRYFRWEDEYAKELVELGLFPQEAPRVAAIPDLLGAVKNTLEPLKKEPGWAKVLLVLSALNLVIVSVVLVLLFRK
ncbi:hypothetical protein ACP70R_016311 [Stipagrostis hirtigluma subsp. patula]